MSPDLHPHPRTIPHLLLVAALLMGAARSSARAQGPSIPTDLVSATPAGVSGDAESIGRTISADGQRVAFMSWATDIVPGTPPGRHTYLRDFAAGTLERIDLSPPGTYCFEAIICRDGSTVFYTVGTFSGQGSLYAYDVASHATTLLSVNLAGQRSVGHVGSLCASADGRFVAFDSNANDLVPGDTNNWYEVFLADRTTGLIERISVADDGSQANHLCAVGPLAKISTDGRYVAFYSLASNLVAGDTNGKQDGFLRDRLLGRTTRVTLGVGGAELSQDSRSLWLSPDGQRIRFDNSSPALLAGDTLGFSDVVERDLVSGAIHLISANALGAPANGHTELEGVSGDGRWMTLKSKATDLDASPGGRAGIYLADLVNDTMERVVMDYRDDPALSVTLVRPSDDARYLLYTSTATTIVAADANAKFDVFRLDRQGHYDHMLAESFCAGDGTGSPCGCGIGGPAGGGCESFLGPAMQLDVEGLASLTLDTLRVTAVNVTSSFSGTTPSGLFVAGSARLNGGLGIPFEQGILCVGGNVVRLANHPGTSNQYEKVRVGYPNGAPLSSLVGPLAAGTTTNFQYLFRTPVMSPPWCTPSQINSTNGMSVTWLP